MPVGNVMMTIPGVLARQTSRLVVAQPLQEGMAVLAGLREMYRVHLVSDDTMAETRHWLTQMGVGGWVTVTTSDDVPDWEGMDPVERRRDQLNRLRAWSSNPDIVIDPSPSVIAMALEEGAIGMLFAHPAYARPEFRPDAPERPGLRKQWNQLAESVARDNGLSRQREEEPLDVIE